MKLTRFNIPHFSANGGNAKEREISFLLLSLLYSLNFNSLKTRYILYYTYEYV